MKDAGEKYIADREARRHLREDSLRKYRLLVRELTARFRVPPVDSVSIDDLSKYRQSRCDFDAAEPANCHLSAAGSIACAK